MNILSNFIKWLFKKETPMAATDFSGMSAKLDKMDGYLLAMKDELATAAANANKVAQLQTALDAANADLATSQASEASAEARLQANLDAMAALLPAPASPNPDSAAV